jgi:hypothetical protein
MTVIFNMKKNSIINLNFLSYKLAQNSCKFWKPHKTVNLCFYLHMYICKH